MTASDWKFITDSFHKLVSEMQREESQMWISVRDASALCRRLRKDADDAGVTWLHAEEWERSAEHPEVSSPRPHDW